MNLKEAFKILELSESASPDEIKKQYKKLTKTYHPDINKAPDAEDKFKKINEAYKLVQDGGESNIFGNSAYYSNPFGKKVRPSHSENINIHTTISFKDSVLGKKQDIKFNRHGKCDNCDGQGKFALNNGCDKCNGRGQIISNQGNMIFAQTCDKCMGRSNMELCKNCNATGTVETEVSVSVSIPGGVVTGNVLRLGNMGNFVGNFIGFDQFTDTFLHITVEKDPDLSLSGQNVISKVDLTLLEAIVGCNKKVKTIFGEKEISIKPLSKNNDDIIIEKMGVNKAGNQVVKLNVSYPNDVSKLINVLKEV